MKFKKTRAVKARNVSYPTHVEVIMYELLVEDLERSFPNRGFITAQELCEFLGCEISVVYNWNKRSDQSRRPPSIPVGKELRFQKRLLARWLADEQTRSRA